MGTRWASADGRSGGRLHLNLPGYKSLEDLQRIAVHQVLVLADDLTGALEVGAKFAATGLPVLATTSLGFPIHNIQQEAVLVMDTETRHRMPEQAGRRVFELSRAGFDAGFQHVYLKTDSTLRGNIASEISALMEALPGLSLLYVPAYPQMGRTVRAGTLYVGGIPVNQTSFAADLLNPVRECNIPRLLSGTCSQPVVSVTADQLAASVTAGIYVCDGETDSDLQAAARKFIESPFFRLAAGPAGFASHLAALMDLPRAAPPRMPVVRQALIVNGSLNEISVQQTRYAGEHGFMSFTDDGTVSAVKERGWVILQVPASTGAPADFSRRLSQSVRALLTRQKFDAVVVFGGDTAYAIVEALGHPDLRPIGEVVEGVPVCAIDRHAAGLDGDGFLYLITKAGGFGPVDVLWRIQKKLARG